MLAQVILVLTFVAAIGSGVIAGVFFAFSCFVMAGLGRLPADQGMAAMNSINVTVINRLFLSVFLGTGLISALLALAATIGWNRPGAWLALIAGLIYLVGCIGVTRFYNVPLNNALAAAQAGTSQAAELWSRYLSEWTAWNTVRTVASTASMVLLLWVLA